MGDPRLFNATPSAPQQGRLQLQGRPTASNHHSASITERAPVPEQSPMGAGGDGQAQFGIPMLDNQAQQSQLPPQVAPRYCQKHDASFKRVKAAPGHRQCVDCGLAVQTNYQEFTLCTWCSDKKDRCMLCGCQVSPVANGNSNVMNSPMAPEIGTGWLAGQRL